LKSHSINATKNVKVASYCFVVYGWILFLFITSIMLIIYNEPEGAYQMDAGMQQQHQGTMQH